MILKLKRTPGLYLVGFMAAGKTTVGRLLADELGWTFVDIDEDIEEQEDSSISDIFDTLGEEGFRDIEASVISRRVHVVQHGRPMVIAVGGGAFTRQENYDLLEENGVTIWLDCPLSLIEQRVMDNDARPLARNLERMRMLYFERQTAYSRADFRVEASGEPVRIMRTILDLPIF